MKPFSIVVLAAGKGKRMESDLAKVLHPICGKPMLFYVLKLAVELKPLTTVVVVGRQKEKVMEAFIDWDVAFVEQPELLGTGDAVLKAEPVLGGSDVDVLVLAGDTPLLTKNTIEEMRGIHEATDADITLLSAIVEDPTGYGRIVRNGEAVERIVEDKDATEEEKSIKEINAGVYLFDKEKLFENLRRVKPDNKQHEYYLTDVVRLIQNTGGNVQAVRAETAIETVGINDKETLDFVEKVMSDRHNDKEEKGK